MAKPRRRKIPPVLSKALRRKGNHPSNPYPRPKERHEDREGWPFPAPRSPKARRADLTDEAQLGTLPRKDAEPQFVLWGSDPLAPHIVRYWARANDYIGSAVTTAEINAAMRLASSMEAWRKRHEARS